MPEKTAEEFFDDDTGRRWFKTGDIGQVLYFLNNASIIFFLLFYNIGLNRWRRMAG